MTYNFQSLEEAAAEYIRVLNTQPNGWGQHIDRLGRQSHFLLMELEEQFGKDQVRAELDRQFKQKAQPPRYKITAFSHVANKRVRIFTWRGLPEVGVAKAQKEATERGLDGFFKDFEAEPFVETGPKEVRK